MPLILAIEPDKRQSSQLAAVVRGLTAELVQGATAADALAALHGRVPDLVLTTSLISPRDDAALAAHLRDLGAAAAHVQTVTIPLLGTAAPAPAKGGMLAALRREKPQAPMTDGCAPDVFADQVRHYLATAAEQKAMAATRVTAAPAPAAEVLASFAAPETVETAERVDPFASFADVPGDIDTPLRIEEPAFQEWPETPAPLEVSEVLAAAPVDVTPAVFAPVEDALPEPEPEREPALVAEFVEPIAAAPVEAIAPVAAEWGVGEETSVGHFVVEECNEEVEAAPEPANSYSDLYVDPMAAQALEELSRQAPAQSLADAVPAEPPVPVVEMQAFQSLDAIASELAAGPSRRHESLDDLASLFAAPSPAPARQESTLFAPGHAEFASLFAAPPPASRPAEPIDVPGIDPSLFASAPTALKPVFEPRPEPVDVASDVFVEPAPEPVLEIAAAPVVELAPEPIAPIVPGPALTEFEVPEPEPMMAAEFDVESEPVFEDPPLALAPPAVESMAEAPVIEAPVAMAATPELTDEGEEFEFDEELDEEIALDVDAFAYTEPEPAAPAEPARFAFTLVDGFGDAWSDFEVPSVAAMAADLGLGERPPLDPYAVAPAVTPAPAAAQVRREETNGRLAAPALDDEALSLIGAAARQVSLDALVIRDFELAGEDKPVKKVKKKVHAGATQVAPAPERPAAKPAPRPVQDEWGMFDPEQAGFAALEDEEGAEARPTTGTRVRVISY